MCCSMSMASKTSCSQAVYMYSSHEMVIDADKLQPFLRSITVTHILGLYFTLKSWAESLVLMSVDYAWLLPETTSTTVSW